VQEGRYDLIGPNGEIILPTIWEKVIQPDWAVTMQMWPGAKEPVAADGRPHGMPMNYPPGHPMFGRHAAVPGARPMMPTGGVPPGAIPRGMRQSLPPGAIPVPPNWAPAGPSSMRPVDEIVVPSSQHKSSSKKKHSAEPIILRWMMGSAPVQNRK